MSLILSLSVMLRQIIAKNFAHSPRDINNDAVVDLVQYYYYLLHTYVDVGKYVDTDMWRLTGGRGFCVL